MKTNAPSCGRVTLLGFWVFLHLFFPGLVRGQTYFSTGSGDWSNTIWSTSPGGPATESDPDNAGISVVIQAGHTVVLNGSGKDVAGLTVEAGAVLTASTLASPRYLDVHGDVIVDGSTEATAGGGISLNIEGGLCNLGGGGNLQFSRIRKISAGGAILNISSSTSILWSGSAGLYHDAFSGTFAINIGSAATVAVGGDVSLNGLSGTTGGIANPTGSLTVAGTLDVFGTLFLRTGTSIGSSCDYAVQGGGTLRVRGLVQGAAGASGTDAANLSLAANALLELTAAGPFADLDPGGRNNFAFAAGSTVLYSGPGGQSVEGGLPYHHLTFSGGSKGLSGSATVNGALTLGGGSLLLNGSELTANGSLVGASGGAFVRTTGGGQLIRPVGSSPVVFPVGNAAYNPVSLALTGPPADLGVGIQDAVFENGTSGAPLSESAVAVSWLITGGSPANTATATLSWNDGQELPFFDESNCFISYFDGGWQQGAPADGSANALTRSGIPVFLVLAVGSGQALPVTLVRFEVALQDGRALLDWQTASEQDNHYFAVERAGRDLRFVEIGRVAGHGTTAVPRSYRFRDERPLPGTSYYRLRQVDFDGSWTHLPVRSLWRPAEDSQAWLYPNPSPGPVRFLLARPARAGEHLRLLASDGTLLQTRPLQAGQQQVDLDLSRRPAGLYRLQGPESGLWFRKR